MKHLAKHIAQAVLAFLLLGSIVVLLGAPSFLTSAMLVSIAVLSGRGLQKLGTFDA